MGLFVRRRVRGPGPGRGWQGQGVPPPEYTRSGGYGAGAAGGSGEGPPRARSLPAIRPLPCRSAVLHYLAVSRLEGFSRETRLEKSSRSIFAWARCIAHILFRLYFQDDTCGVEWM